MKRKQIVPILIVCLALGIGVCVYMGTRKVEEEKTYEKRIYISYLGEWTEFYFKEDGNTYTRKDGEELACAIPGVVREENSTAGTVDGEGDTGTLNFPHMTARDFVEETEADDIPIAEETEADDIPIAEEGGSAAVTRLALGDGYGADGLFYLPSDAADSGSGGHCGICELRDGRLVELEQQVYEAKFERDGESLELHIEWASNGTAAGAAFVAGDGRCSVLQWMDGDGSRALALLQLGEQVYPAVLKLTENQVEDLTQGVALDRISGTIRRAHLSRDGELLLIEADREYCLVLADKALLCLDEVCGRGLAGCGFVGDGSIACWSTDFTLPDESAQKEIREDGKAVKFDMDYGSTTLYKVDPKAGTAREAFSDLVATVYTNPGGLWHGTEVKEGVETGLIYLNDTDMECRYLLELGEEDRVYVLDLADCSRKRLGKLSWPSVVWPDAELVGNRAGDKILLCQRDLNGGIRRFSVIDLANQRYLLVKREQEWQEEKREALAGWFDNDTVMVDENAADGGGHHSGEGWHSLYRVR